MRGQIRVDRSFCVAAVRAGRWQFSRSGARASCVAYERIRRAGAAPAGRDASSTAGPAITSLPPVVYIGDNFLIQGSGFTSGSVVNFFVATAGGPINFGPLVPTDLLPDQMMAFLPLTVTQGEGVASVQVVNTDEGHIASNNVVALLQGDPASGLPSVTGINGVGLSPSSVRPGYRGRQRGNGRHWRRAGGPGGQRVRHHKRRRSRPVLRLPGWQGQHGIPAAG